MEINSLSSLAASYQKTQSTTQEIEVKEVVQQRVDSSAVSPAQKTQQETPEVLAKQVLQLNNQLEKLGQSLAFAVDENTQSSVVKVIDKTTDEVIKQFPSEGSLRIMQNIQNYLTTVQQSGLQAKEGLTGALFSEII
ncbi:MAG: flagellar protein FlaG [Pseudomonadota bacterium]|nr:flagellar protein FlaG [Pseudomonadota bacterium]